MIWINTKSYLTRWVIGNNFVYVGVKSKYFTYDETYYIYTGGSEFNGFVDFTDNGEEHVTDLKLKDDFVLKISYSKYLRKKKLLKLNKLNG